jgi:hypothetical protein
MSDYSMNELTYHVAASLDGFIAHKDGSFAGLEETKHMTAASSCCATRCGNHKTDP